MCTTFLSLSHAPRFAVLAKCLIELQFLFGFSGLHVPIVFLLVPLGNCPLTPCGPGELSHYAILWHGGVTVT